MLWKYSQLKYVVCLLLLSASLHSFFNSRIETIVLLIIFLVGIFFAVVWIKKENVCLFCLVILILTSGLLLTLGTLYSLYSEKSIKSFVSKKGGYVTCQGEVLSVKNRGDTLKLIVEDLACKKRSVYKPLTGRLFLTVYQKNWFSKKYFMARDVVRFRASIKPPRDLKNFGKKGFENYCLAKNIAMVGSVYNSAWIMVVGNSRGLLSRSIVKIQRLIETNINRSFNDEDLQAFAKAVILGQKDAFSEELLDSFKTLGIVHLIVVSGLHVAILAALCWYFFLLLFSSLSKMFGQIDIRVPTSILSLVIVWLYILVSGLGTPSLRAGILVSLYLLAIMFRQKYALLDALFFSLLLFMVCNPLSVYDVSFQMTYAAIFGILLMLRFTLIATKGESKLSYFIKGFANFCLISLGAILGVYPIILYHFGEVSLVGPLFNLFLSPIATFVIIPLLLIGSLGSLVSLSFGSALFFLVKYPTKLFIDFSLIVGREFGWAVTQTEINLCVLFLIYSVVILAVFWKNRRARIILFVLSLSLLLGSIMGNSFANIDGKLLVTFLDVGQGASVVVRTPENKIIIIDGGGSKGASKEFGKYAIEPYLKRMNVVEIDRIIVTHPHPDHYKGLIYIAHKYKPRYCVVGDFQNDLDDIHIGAWSEFLEEMKVAGVLVVSPDDIEWNYDEVKFNFLSPPQEIPSGWNVNDSSIAIKLKHNSRSFLITGDIEEGAEAYLVKNSVGLKSDVIQVPHHGSSTSSSEDFLDKVSADHAVIQLGAFNKYGFPAKEVLERLKQSDAKIYRTDVNGAISFISDGEKIRVVVSED